MTTGGPRALRGPHLRKGGVTRMAGNAHVRPAEGGGSRRRDRHGRRLLSRHAGPAHRQALPGRVLPRRRPRGDARLRLSARQRHRHGAGARLRRRQLGKGLRRFRHEAGPGDAAAHSWLPGTALVLCDMLDHHHHEPVPHTPARHAAGSRSRGSTAMGMSSYFASELEFYLFDETYESAEAKALAATSRPPAPTSRTITSSRPPRRRG